MKRALIVGGMGAIGSHLAETLLKRGYETVVIDNLITGKIQNIDHLLKNPYFIVINDSILNEQLIDTVMKEVSVVFHLAVISSAEHIKKDPLQGLLLSIRGTEIVFSHAFKYWKRVVLASTSQIYGLINDNLNNEHQQCSFREADWMCRSEPVLQTFAEHLAFAYFRRGLPMTVVRYFNPYGPRLTKSDGCIVTEYINQALHNNPLTICVNGEQNYCFTYIDDIVNATITVGEERAAIGQAFNIGNNVYTTITELVDRIKQMTRTKSAIRFINNDITSESVLLNKHNHIPDASKFTDLFGFKAGVDFETGLAKTIEWNRNTMRYCV